MAILDQQVEDLIAAAALDEDDADELRALVERVRARKDAKLRGDVQRTVGETHLTLREGMDRIIGLQVDTRGVLDTLVQHVETQGAALDAARAEFQGGINEVGERISHDVGELRGEVAVMSDDIGALKQAAIRQERINGEIIKRLDKSDTRLSYLEAGQAHINSRVGDQDRRLAEIATQLELATAERDQLNQQQQKQVDQIQELTRQIEELRTESAGRLPAAEQREKVRQIEDLRERMDAVEARQAQS